MALTRPRAAQIYNIDYKQATRVVTIAPVTLAGGAPNQVDGVNLTVNDRVLVTAQSTGSQNGIYVVQTVGSGSNGTWVRSTDNNTTGELNGGTVIIVSEGLTYKDTIWMLTTDDPIVIGTTSLNFVQTTGTNLQYGNANVFSYLGSNSNVVITTTGNISTTGNIFGNVGNLSSLQLNNTVTPITASVGQAFWDTGEHTVTLGMENGVQQQIGLENYMYVKASAAITNGQAVMFTGANGTNILGAPANTASVGFKSEYIIGVATQDIANNAFGYITVFGLVHNLNTNAWNVGDILWVDNTTPGALTNVQPTDPNYQIQMAAVTKKAGGDGHIQVRVTPFYQLDRLRNVQTTSPTTGQALVYDGANSIWINGNTTSVGTLSSLSVTGNITTSNANIISTTASTSKTTGALTVAGGIGVAGDLVAGNSTVVDGGAYGNVTTTQFASVFGSGGGPNPYSIMQVRSSDGVSGLGMQAYTGSGTLYGNTAITFALGQIRDKDVPSSLTTKAYIDSTGLNVTGIVSATGNITGSYILGNGSQLTGLASGNSISNGNSNVVVANDGNVTVTIAGAGPVGKFSPGELTVFGIYSNPNTIDDNVVIQANTNSMMVGPVSVNPVNNIFVPDGSALKFL